VEKEKQPGISFDKIFLSKLEFDVLDFNSQNTKYAVDFENNPIISEDKKLLVHRLKVDVMKGVESPRFKLIFELVGVFKTEDESANMELGKFAEYNAPALMMPFAREIISSITSKSIYPTLLIPPSNIYAILKKKPASSESKPKQ
jgi:preprotein translocase subunit SecB